ncbi:MULTISPECIES: hypothetical protein [Salegentibacter]|uniref:Uncharacterized protein n=1 Tax=Salegentibacter maritimus TaxID=2794347 RepID=A0ABS0TK46_9FLAO|nr:MULTISPECIES: hypothetical protein [Salegentibacter]MBE7641416.1 hypothetical protein [Salegentibacter sp. BLCTC]MBI6116246.1 hypothetical protein [Salegentibacter maritimus]MBI6121002.1 hypothetical protein [Salegentibacter maritimus]
MESVILKGESKEDLKLLIKLANKLGIEAQFLKSNELEEYAFGLAIEEGVNEEEMSLEDFKQSLLKDEGKNQ